MSSVVSSQSKIEAFSIRRSTLEDLGMTAVPLYTPHLRSTCAADLECLAAISRIEGKVKGLNAASTPSSTKDVAPKLLYAVTAMSFILQYLSNFC